MSGNRVQRSPAEETSSDSIWLRRAEQLLTALGGAGLAEAILGDLQELRPEVEAHWGKAVSWLWLALEIARGAAVLGAQRLRTGRKENPSMDNWNMTVRRAAAAFGLVACLPALVLVVGGLLQSEGSTPALRATLERTLFNPDLAGFRVLIHPATILSGLVLAAGLNLVPLLRLGLERRPGTLVGTLALRIRAAHLGVALAALGLMGVILGYAFTENFKVVPTHVQLEESEGQPVGTPRVVRILPVDETITLHIEDGTRLLIPTPPARGD
ncbi:MAG: hypothetical protein ACRDHG_01355 [Anaerolineales bacterium]